MTNVEIAKLLNDYVARRAIGKPFTDEEYETADAEDKAKMDDYAAFCAYLAECDTLLDEEKLDDEGYYLEEQCIVPDKLEELNQ